MNNTKHTPGPWIVRRHEDSDTKDIRGASGEEIALCYAGDAALIAAAPAMYEALVRFAKAIKAECYDEDILVDIYHDVRDALAQAEGRQA